MKIIRVEFLVLIVVLCSAQQEKKNETVSESHDDNDKVAKEAEFASISPKPTTLKKLMKSERTSKYVCPGNEAPRSFFSIPCKVTKECAQLGNKNMLCCNNRCLKGIPAPPPEPVHSPTLFGLVARVCPKDRIPEIWEVKQCSTDSECTPRICCTEQTRNGDIVGFCRTSEPVLDNVPGLRQLSEPLKLMMSYMHCTPPPPPLLDVFPKQCQSPLDCFPNLCCQEGGKKYCRPARRSLLTLLTTVAQRIVPTNVARDFINRMFA